MINNLINALDNYWEVRNKPKHDLYRVEDDFINLQKGNLITIGIVITIFTISVLFIGAGALS